MEIKHLFSVFFLMMLVACGKGDSGGGGDQRVPEITREEIQAVMENQRFECASLGGGCPSGIARILIIDQFDTTRSAACTGFMVSPTRLVTNNHCVSTAGTCANTYLAIYDGNNYQPTKCKTILSTSQDVDDPNDPSRKLDFTVMEIETPYQGEFFRLSGANANPGDLIHTWVVDHTGLEGVPSNLTDSRITEFDCEVLDQNSRASLVMIRCPIISGNSGSPAVDTSGNVIGIVWGGSSNTYNSTLDLRIRRRLNEVALATEVDDFREFVLLNHTETFHFLVNQ